MPAIPPTSYCDGRPAARLRLEAVDEGVVLRHGEPHDAVGARDVYVWRHDEQWYMHYDAAGPRGWLVALAASDDGRRWVKHGPVLDFGAPGEPDSASASYGVPYYDGRLWHLFYLGTPNTMPIPGLVPAFPYQTLKATAPSPAGPWAKQKHVIPIATVPGTYYSVTASPGGNIIKRGDEYLQIFSVADQQGDLIRRTLAIATTRDLDGRWTVADAPILPLEEQIENTSLYYEPGNQTWYLFTNHVGITPQDGEYTDAIWVYWSKDLTRWDRDCKAVVLDGSNCTWSRCVIGLPSVVPQNDRLLIYYDELSEEGSTSHIGRDIGLATLPLPLRGP
jgi:predicted GH43/DUF377 family glycosyl hydrolase